jgi:hypothetical protein
MIFFLQNSAFLPTQCLCTFRTIQKANSVYSPNINIIGPTGGTIYIQFISINSLYIFRALAAYHQEVLYIRQLVMPCVYVEWLLEERSGHIPTALYTRTKQVKVRQSKHITGLDRPIGFQEVEAPRFQEIRHIRMVSLSALRTGRLKPPGIIPGTHFC